ncbi:MAG: hypothetical protein ABI444_07300 [Candidatus Kapaibacterium sp.]
MKTTMKLAFAFLVFFGFAVGAKGQVGIERDNTDLAMLLKYKTTGGFIRAVNNDSASWYGTHVESYKTAAYALFKRLSAMDACGADTFKWVEDPNFQTYGSYPRTSTAALMPVIRRSVSRDAVIADLKQTVARGLYCIKRYQAYVGK